MSEPICQSNLKAVGVALAVYSQDNDDRLPPESTWMDALGNYIQPQIFACQDKEAGLLVVSLAKGRGGRKLSELRRDPTLVLAFTSKDLTRNAVSAAPQLVKGTYPGAAYVLLSSGTVIAKK